VLIVRPIGPGDLDALVDLAHQLDSMNLPAEREFLDKRIQLSERSFAGAHADWRDGVYVFALEDTDSGRCVGTSTIIAKHGRPGRPYFWLAVTNEERRSADLGVRFVHPKLQLFSTEDGPTEIGGIILDPAYRRHKEKCGKALSIVRFAYISMHPERFEREVIAEMLSPFDESGRSLLWDAFGARFTGLPYREADHLSGRTKQFIADLFPRDPVYVTLFPEPVQAVIGRPGDSTKAALHILEKIGFRAARRGRDARDGAREPPGARRNRGRVRLPRHRGADRPGGGALRIAAVPRCARRDRRRPDHRDAPAVTETEGCRAGRTGTEGWWLRA
jgi:arginine N-succinyltransferase